MFLKIYTVFYIAVYLMLVFNPEVLPKYGIWEAIDFGFMVIAFVGMAAYTFRIKMLIRKFWEYFLYIFIIFELVYMTWLQMPLLEKLNMADQTTLNNLFNILLMVPLVYALFRLQQRWEAVFGKRVEGVD